MDNNNINKIYFVLVFVLFFYLTLVYPGHGYSDFLFLFSTASAVIFGIFIAITFSNSRERLNKTNELLKNENANLFSIHKLSRIFSSKDQKAIDNLIDQYLIDQIDFRLEDFDRSSNSSDKLHNFIINLKCNSTTQERIHAEMLSTVSNMNNIRTMIETVVSQKISDIEWVSIYGLTATIIICLWEMTDKQMSVFHIILTSLLASTSLLLVLVLREMDALKWQKNNWTWIPLHRLFLSMGLIPYYPENIITSGEAKVPEGERVRIAKYPNKYPDITDKKVYHAYIKDGKLAIVD